MNGPTRRLATALFLGFVMLLGSVTWMQVIAADTYRNDPRNLRTSISESGKERGVIVTADGTVVARSVPSETDPQSFVRVYPEGPAYAPVVGYTSRLAGSAGLEAVFADELRSRRDLTPSDMISAIFGRDLRPRSIQIAVVPELQELAFEALGGNRGAVVALDPRTGDVLAYVTSPTYDPQDLAGPEGLDNRAALLDDPAGPLRDRAGNEILRPGSSFKTVVAAAAFESGDFTPESLLEDPPQFQLPGSSATISNSGGGVCADGNARTSWPRRSARSCSVVRPRSSTGPWTTRSPTNASV